MMIMSYVPYISRQAEAAYEFKKKPTDDIKSRETLMNRGLLRYSGKASQV